MRLALMAAGSRGDVQPFVALGAGFRAAGHEVRLVTHADYEAAARARGLEFFGVSANPRAMFETPEAQRLLRPGGNPLRFFSRLAQMLEPLVEQVLAEGLAACADVDAMVFSTLNVVGARDVAAHLGRPHCFAFLQPLAVTSDFGSPFFPQLPTWLGPVFRAYNRWSHRTLWALLDRLFGRIAGCAIEKVTGISPAESARLRKRDLDSNLALHAYSTHVVPRPAEWPPNVQVTGFWFLEELESWRPPTGLVDFLESGPPPVYVGFGSMKTAEAEHTTSIVIEALRRAGQRGIVLTGWGGLSGGNLPEGVFAVDSAPHDWLFPRMAAVVHHGGAGTTAAGLRAGVPSVVVPFVADQHFWARRVHRLGVGPEPIPRKVLSAGRLSRAIAVVVGEDAIRKRAETLGRQIRAEQGVARAVAAAERHFHARSLPARPHLS